MIPSQIEVRAALFGEEADYDHTAIYPILLIFRDTTGDQWAAFEINPGNVATIHLGSNFFVRFLP